MEEGEEKLKSKNIQISVSQDNTLGPYTKKEVLNSVPWPCGESWMSFRQLLEEIFCINIFSKGSNKSFLLRTKISSLLSLPHQHIITICDMLAIGPWQLHSLIHISIYLTNIY